jgi:hypothetical protein
MLNVLNPFRTTLKYDVNPIKRTVTLTPTMGTLARSFVAPTVVMVGLVGLIGLVGLLIQEKATDEETETPQDPDEK